MSIKCKGGHETAEAKLSSGSGIAPATGKLGVMVGGLGVGAERCGAMPAGQGQAAQIGQGAEMGDVAPQHLEIGLLGLIVAAEPGQQGAALEQGVQVVGARRECGFDIAQRRLERAAPFLGLVAVRLRRWSRA